jgi:hypothetical protein
VAAAFAQTADGGAGAEGEIAAVEAGELVDAQPGLDGGEQQRAVSSAFPSCSVGALTMASICSAVRKDTVGLSNRFGGMAIICWISPATAEVSPVAATVLCASQEVVTAADVGAA